VRDKGNKQRYVPIGSTAMTEIASYQRRERKPQHRHLQQVFLGRHGEPMTRSGVGIRLTKLGKTSNVTRNQVAPHAFRRGFAVQFLRNGGDVFTLQQIPGHSTLEMTRRYVSFLDEDLKTAHLRFSPGDRL
jgi:integrase/recombinase XerD